MDSELTLDFLDSKINFILDGNSVDSFVTPPSSSSTIKQNYGKIKPRKTKQCAACDSISASCLYPKQSAFPLKPKKGRKLNSDT